jgi:hypothetical protein
MSQRGVSLVFALLALAALMLAGVALVRSVDSGAMVIGNLGFKQEATSAADRAAEAARAVLTAPPFDVNFDSPANGYYATSQDALDPTGQVTSAANPLAVVNWGDADSCACLSTTPATCSSCSRTPRVLPAYNNVRASYVITRLCPLTGDLSATNACAKPASTALSQAAARGEVNAGTGRPDNVVAVPYYRIIVRSVGTRGTVSFTETIVH